MHTLRLKLFLSLSHTHNTNDMQFSNSFQHHLMFKWLKTSENSYRETAVTLKLSQMVIPKKTSITLLTIHLLNIISMLILQEDIFLNVQNKHEVFGSD